MSKTISLLLGTADDDVIVGRPRWRNRMPQTTMIINCLREDVNLPFFFLIVKAMCICLSVYSATPSYDHGMHACMCVCMDRQATDNHGCSGQNVVFALISLAASQSAQS